MDISHSDAQMVVGGDLSFVLLVLHDDCFVPLRNHHTLVTLVIVLVTDVKIDFQIGSNWP